MLVLKMLGGESSGDIGRLSADITLEGGGDCDSDNEEGVVMRVVSMGLECAEDITG